MKKQLFFLHSAGAQGSHEGSSDLVAWLQNALGGEYEVIHPIMPNPDNPDYEPWKQEVATQLAHLSDNVVLVGHSFGGSVLLKYLVEEKVSANIRGLFLIATPFWGADEDWQYKPFALRPDFANALSNIPQIFMYQSQDDPIVPFAHFEQYRQAIPHSIARAIPGDDHTFESGLPQLATDIKSL